MLSYIIKRSGQTEPFDAEKLLNSLKFILKQLNINDNPISKKIFKQAVSQVEKSSQSSDSATSEEIRQAVATAFLENKLRQIADFYTSHKDKKLPLDAQKQTYKGRPVKAINSGLKIQRHRTKTGQSVFDQFKYEKRNSIIRDPDGKVIAEIKDVEVPVFWTQVATDILAQKYLRKAGVPKLDNKGQAMRDKDGELITGRETGIKQVAKRLAGCWRYWGEKYGYFYSKEDADAYEDEMTYTIIGQLGAPNSPQWFNTGLAYAYNITGTPQGHFLVNPDTGVLENSPDAYTHPQPHACFIQSVSDDLVNEGGIFDLITREARLFKYGSGTGSNFSNLRSSKEKLSGGGYSSGMMSFLKIFDQGAGAIKSGGTTRRAAKMVVVDINHPDIEQFINWKMTEEQKVAAMISGSWNTNHFLNKIMNIAVKEKEYKSIHKPTWCPGCGNYAIWIALQNALKKLGIPQHKVLIVFGVGCSGNMANTLHTYGWHSLHGRALPTAAGAKLANKDLTVIVAAGDGDGYGEGVSHFIHSIRGNADVTYLVHDNRVYGLTTGQAAPTARKGYKAKSTPLGLIEQPFNPIAIALATGAEFIARAFSGKPEHIMDVIVKAIQHRGFSLVDVLQPCVTFNKLDTYDLYNKISYNLQEDSAYDASNFDMAMERAFESKKLPIGVFYENKRRSSYDQEIAYLKDKSLVSQPPPKRDISRLLRDFI